MEPARTIIEKLGGPKAVAQAAGVSTKSVYCWRLPRERRGTGGVIPHWHIETLLAYSAAIGGGLTAQDFVPCIPPSRTLPPTTAPAIGVDCHNVGPP